MSRPIELDDTNVRAILTKISDLKISGSYHVFDDRSKSFLSLIIKLLYSIAIKALGKKHEGGVIDLGRPSVTPVSVVSSPRIKPGLRRSSSQ
jgi:hypothetical protein